MTLISSKTARLLAVVAIVFSHTISLVSAAEIVYCSSQNTGANSESIYNIYNSHGECSARCNERGAAFAIVLRLDCWCSDYIPADQTDTQSCNSECPGFPDEKCGNLDERLFGYLRINGRPSGTQGASQPSPTPEQSSSRESSPPPSTSESAADPPSSTAASPTSLQITVVSGITVIKTFIPTYSAEPTNTSSNEGGTSVGGIVGGVLGGVAALAVVVGGVIFLLRRRRKRSKDDEQHESGVQRNTSTMSKAGLLRTEKQPPRIATTFNSRHNRSPVLDTASVSPASATERRNSRPYVFDQRLNPQAIMTFENPSRSSLASMDDSRDYGRTLNVRNPDPEPH